MLLSLLGNDQKGNELDLEEIAAMSPEIVAASTESLKSYFMCVFAIADENQDGVLSKSEVSMNPHQSTNLGLLMNGNPGADLDPNPNPHLAICTNCGLNPDLNPNGHESSSYR